MTILVNNAGVVSGKKFFDVADKMVDLTLQVNTAAHFWVRLLHIYFNLVFLTLA